MIELEKAGAFAPVPRKPNAEIRRLTGQNLSFLIEVLRVGALFGSVAFSSGCSEAGTAPDGTDTPSSSTGGADGVIGDGDGTGGVVRQPMGGSSSGGSSSGGAASGGSSSGDGDTGTGGAGDWLVLDQTGNPIYGELSNYESWLSSLSADTELADNMLTWQMPHGGFYKNAQSVYAEPWNGSEARSGWTGQDGVELGTIDNDGTVTELLVLADVYGRTSDTQYRDGARAALNFLLTMQYPSGGFPQVYPARTGTSYSNHVTFNDNAMVRVLALLLRVVQEQAPVDGDVFTAEQRSSAEQAIHSAVDYILQAQIEQDGAKTVWCAQHDPVTFEPRGARSYELPSKSGKESVGVVTFLMTQPQTREVQAAVEAAVAWYRSGGAKIEDTAYVKRPGDSTDDNYNPIQASPGSTMWCRFYDLHQDTCFFSGRLPSDNPPGEGKQYDIMDIEPERRYGYEWGGGYGNSLLTYADSVGY